MTTEEAYVRYKEIFDFAEIGKDIDSIVDVNLLMTAPAAPTLDSGLAYDGSVLFHTLMVWHFANKLLPIYSKIAPIDIKSLAKVVVL